MTVTPIRPHAVAPDSTVAMRDAFAEAIAAFTHKHGHAPTGACFVLSSATVTMPGWCELETLSRAQLALAGARLTHEALT